MVVLKTKSWKLWKTGRALRRDLLLKFSALPGIRRSTYFATFPFALRTVSRSVKQQFLIKKKRNSELSWVRKSKKTASCNQRWQPSFVTWSNCHQWSWKSQGQFNLAFEFFIKMKDYFELQKASNKSRKENRSSENGEFKRRTSMSRTSDLRNRNRSKLKIQRVNYLIIEWSFVLIIS